MSAATDSVVLPFAQQQYRRLMDFSTGSTREREVVRTTIRHIEPLLMTLGYLDAHAVALHNNTATHIAPIRDEMLDLTPDTLMSDFIPRLKRRLRQLSISFNISDIPGVQVLWQPLTIDSITGELCVDSSFNDKLIEVNAQITEAILALNRLKHEHAPSPSPSRMLPTDVTRALRFGPSAVSIDPDYGDVIASEMLREPVAPFSPAYVPSYVDDAADVVVELESPTSPMDVGAAAISTQRRSYVILIHGDVLSSDWFKYPIEPKLCCVNYTAACVGQNAPEIKTEISLGALGTMKLSGIEFMREDPNNHKDIVFGMTGEPCPRGQGWIGLNPMLFTCDAAEEQVRNPGRARMDPEIGIWAFDAVDDIIGTKRNVIDISQLKRLYNTDRSYGTYRLLFDLIKTDLEANPIHPDCQINIVYHVCRTGKQVYCVTNKFVTFDEHDFSFIGRARPLYKYPNEANIVIVSQVPSDYVMEMIGFNVQHQAIGMQPLGSRNVQHGLHFVLQGCFYNLMVYLGIISHDEGEVLTSIQNEGITSRMFLNFVDLMNTRRSFAGLRQFDRDTSPFIVERLPIDVIRQLRIDPNNGISKLLHVMISMSSTFANARKNIAHVIFAKLMHKRRDDTLVNTEEVGHWVAFVIDPNDVDVTRCVLSKENDYRWAIETAPWRFVDPQSLSTHTETQSDGSSFSYTVPMSSKPLRTLDELIVLLNGFSPKFSHIDLFYIAIPPGQGVQDVCLNPPQVTNSCMPRHGGKTNKRLNQLKPKPKTKRSTGSTGSTGSRILPAVHRLLSRAEVVPIVLYEGRPVAITWREERIRLLSAVGPERIAGEWWTGTDAARDYWRCVEAGSPHRELLLVRQGEQWSVVGWRD